MENSWWQPDSFFALLQPCIQFGAFWLAIVRFHGPGGGRFAIGLALGAGFARLGWVLLHGRDWLDFPSTLWDGSGGFTVLGVPLGPLLLTPRGASVQRGLTYRISVARALTPAFALSRLGCVVMGCCGGGRMLEVVTHPVAVYEIIAWLVLSRLLDRMPGDRVSGSWLLAFGGVRLLLEPLRASPSLGEPEIDVAWFAGAWMLLGGWFFVVDPVRHFDRNGRLR